MSLTAAEQASARHLPLAFAATFDALDLVSLAAAANATDTFKAGYLAAQRAVVEAMRCEIRAFGMLLGSQTEDDASTFAGKTRAEIVGYAWGTLDRAVSQLALAKSSASGLVIDPAYATKLALATSEIKTVDRTLTYADPIPPIPEGQTTAKVVGPHGDYVMAQNSWNSVGRFLSKGMDKLATAYATVQDYQNLRLALRDAAICARLSIYACARVQGMVFDGDDARNRFFFVLRILKSMTKIGAAPTPAQEDHQLPYFLLQSQQFAWAVYKHPATPLATKDVLVSALIDLSRCWESSDNGVWGVTNFPDCSLAHNPEGCGGLG